MLSGRGTHDCLQTTSTKNNNQKLKIPTLLNRLITTAGGGSFNGSKLSDT
jgi:hypothetical protein